MKKNKLLYMMLVAAMMFGCSKDMEYEGQNGIPINLGYTVLTATETRAATNLNSNYLTKDDKITVKVSKHSLNSYTDYTYLVVNNTGKMIPASSTIPTYPDNSTIDIAAYYPATAGTSFSVMADQTSDENYRASDLLFASVSDQGAQAAAVELQFAHQMAKIMVNASGAVEGITVNSIKLKGIAPTVTFSQTAAVNYLSNPASGDPIDITMSNNGAALIPQQTINGTFLEVITSMGTATFALSKTFEAGHQYTLNISINSAAIGTTNTITGWTGDGAVNVNAYYSYAPANARAVDLGLSVKWANMNVGATRDYDYGTYFSWGETSGYTVAGHDETAAAGNMKTYFGWSTYVWCLDTDAANTVTQLIKYCSTSTQGTYWFDKTGSKVPADDLSVLELNDDAAHVNWGGDWRIPTRAEYDELLDPSNCNWVWTSDYNSSGVAGYIVTSKKAGYTSNSIFFPAAGLRSHTGSDTGFKFMHSQGFYWSSTLDTSYPMRSDGLYFTDSQYSIYHNYDHRSVGRSIRAVY